MTSAMHSQIINQDIEDDLTSVYLSEQNSNYSLKKRWYEETVFKNQARSSQQIKKRFINDTVRSDFHKKFMNKYIH